MLIRTHSRTFFLHQIVTECCETDASNFYSVEADLANKWEWVLCQKLQKSFTFLYQNCTSVLLNELDLTVMYINLFVDTNMTNGYRCEEYNSVHSKH